MHSQLLESLREHLTLRDEFSRSDREKSPTVNLTDAYDHEGLPVDARPAIVLAA